MLAKQVYKTIYLRRNFKIFLPTTKLLHRFIKILAINNQQNSYTNQFRSQDYLITILKNY
jgi:hypothetical protein